MSGIATTLHEWVSIFCPRAADAGRYLGPAWWLVFWLLPFSSSPASALLLIGSLENAQKRDRSNKAEGRLHVVFGDFMTENGGRGRLLLGNWTRAHLSQRITDVRLLASKAAELDAARKCITPRYWLTRRGRCFPARQRGDADSQTCGP